MTDDSGPKTLLEIKDYVDRNPLDLAAWMKMGYFHLDADQQSEAKKCFLKVLELDPGDVEAQVNLDRIHLLENQKGSKRKAIKVDRLVWIETEIPLWLQLVIGLFSFLVIFLLAMVENWTAADMIWSLWITSLTIGYCYLFAGIISDALRRQMFDESSLINRLFQDTFPLAVKFVFIFISMGFQLIFFTLHFGIFHFVFSIFLNDLFPILDRSFEKFSDFFFYIGISLKSYWPVILFTALASLRKFQRILSQSEGNFAKSAYTNLLKIFVSIFLFSGLSVTGFQTWMLALIFIFYFYPFTAFFEFLKKLKKKPVVADKIND